MLTQTFLAEADGEGGVNGAAPAQPLSSPSLHQPFSAMSVAGARATCILWHYNKQQCCICTHARMYVCIQYSIESPAVMTADDLEKIARTTGP